VGRLTLVIHSFIHSGDLYSASSRDYYSEAHNKALIMFLQEALSWPTWEGSGTHLWVAPRFEKQWTMW